MSKKSDKKTEQFPIEFPSRSGEIKRSPIVDVVENEVFPMKADIGSDGVRRQSGVQLGAFDNIAEVVATEISPDTAEQTTRGL